jgi:hypothetical protein
MTIQNRIYIAEQIKSLKLDEQWIEALDSLAKSRDPERYGAIVRQMMNAIVEKAIKHY